jgi:hypothetical protein
MACFNDYKLTPEQLPPGYEKHLAASSPVLVCASLAWRRRRAKRLPGVD